MWPEGARCDASFTFDLDAEALRSFGAEVVGYRSPSWDFSPHTLELLQAHGMAYSSNFMDDSWTRSISTTEAVRSLWEKEFLGIRKLGFVRDHDDVWVRTTGEIASRT